MSGGKDRHEHRQGRNRQCPGLFVQQGIDDAEDVGGEFGVAAVRAVYAAASLPESRKEFVRGARAGHLGMGQAHSRNGVGVAAGDGRFSETRREIGRVRIGFLAHLAVTRFQRRNIRSEPVEIVFVAAPGQAGKNMVHAKEKLPFGEVHHQRDEVIAAALNFHMIALANIVDADMHLGAGRHAHGNFFTEKEIRILAQNFGGVDGVMVRDGHDSHAQFFEAFIHLAGVVIGFAANAI